MTCLLNNNPKPVWQKTKTNKNIIKKKGVKSVFIYFLIIICLFKSLENLIKSKAKSSKSKEGSLRSKDTTNLTFQHLHSINWLVI